MKRTKEFLLVFILTTSVTLGQEEVIQGQLFLGLIGVGQNEFVQHKIEALGPVWVKNNPYEINYFIASNQLVYQSIASTIGNYQRGNNQTIASFNWFWEGIIQSVGSWGLGIYKISNSKYPENYFYLDARNNVYPDTSVNPDVWFIYNVAESKYYCYFRCGAENIPIEKGSLVRISDILNINYRTDRLLNFWENALIIIPSTTQPQCPRLVWGEFSNFNPTGYRIYWRLGQTSNFGLLSTTSSNSFDYIHDGLSLGYGMVAEYKVQAYNNNSSSNFTNPSSINVSGFYKQNYNYENNPNFYNLMQNYPNPFNPTTTIEYTIPKNSFVSIKVYDILGNEVVTLVNEYREAGRYSVKFDASGLSSGLYFYTMNAGGYILTKKFSLIK